RRTPAVRRPVAFAGDRRRLRVGLVNNMPDAALAVTERQFRSLVEAAAPERDVELHLFHLPGVSRGAQARARLRTRYRPVADVEQAGLDALIVTGAEPRAADLRDEPFWPGFRRLVDWADTAALPVLWSCLAAHAAVLHLDGIVRTPLAQKCSGLFACTPAARPGADPMLAGLEGGWVAPHSRGNGLDAAELTGCGYSVLTHAAEAGVDTFVRRSGYGLFLFLQGHLEYDANSLALEFKRDLKRYADGQRPDLPVLPRDVFGPDTSYRLEALVEAARRDRRPELMGRWPPASGIALAANTWRAPAARLVRNWLASSHVGVEAGPASLHGSRREQARSSA
ncbi:homoserine O-succinyltransferase, partial [Caulobacter sp. S45]|uniref:homoserine O-succinyltransferase MetA n=1 Tax=Caulobacter sp. S45 TaxID=1641861 RepID=UPI001C2D030E